MKLCILVTYKFLTKNYNFGVSQCIFGHVGHHSDVISLCVNIFDNVTAQHIKYLISILNQKSLFSHLFDTITVYSYLRFPSSKQINNDMKTK